MKPDEIHVFAASMFRHLEKVGYVFKAARAREIGSDVGECNRFDGVDFDLAVLHLVPFACAYAGPMPYANAAGDRARSDTVAQILHEQHAPV